MTSRPRVTLWIALLLIAAACGGAEDTGSLTPTTARGPDWGSGMTYSDCIDQGLTDHGLRTGQKWIGDFYADLYHCTAPTHYTHRFHTPALGDLHHNSGAPARTAL